MFDAVASIGASLLYAVGLLLLGAPLWAAVGLGLLALYIHRLVDKLGLRR